MRCTTYCTAAAYDIPRLFQSLQKFGTAQLFRDCIHLLLKEDRKPKGDIFYLSYGCVVLWGWLFMIGAFALGIPTALIMYRNKKGVQS